MLKFSKGILKAIAFMLVLEVWLLWGRAILASPATSIQYCIPQYGRNTIECDIATDGKINVLDVSQWLSIEKDLPDRRFGVDLAVLKKEDDVSPRTGQPRFNKSLMYQAVDFGLSPENGFSWTRNELNAGNKAQFIQTNLAYYTSKDRLLGKYSAQKPEWLSNEDLSRMGFFNWLEIPGEFPVWSPGVIRWDIDTNTWEKNDFAAGTTVFRGWRDVNNNCVLAGQSGSFLIYKNDGRQFEEFRRVPQGSYGEALPPLRSEYIELCDSYIWEEQFFWNFVNRHSGKGYIYIIFNEMMPAFHHLQDVMAPEKYIWHYRYYYNMIKGYEPCVYNGQLVEINNQGLDPTAKILIGTSAQTWITNSQTKPWGSGYDWYDQFYEAWRQKVGTCTPKGPFQAIEREGKSLIPTDGVNFYVYLKYPSPRQGTCQEARTALQNWKNSVSYHAQKITTDYQDKFSSAQPYLKEFGLYQGSFRAELFDYWKNYLDHCPATADCELVYQEEMEKFAKQDLFTVSEMTNWLSQQGLINLGIPMASWLPTYDYLNWREKMAFVPLLRLEQPSTSFGFQIFSSPQSPLPFISPQLTGFYVGLRGSSFGCQD